MIELRRERQTDIQVFPNPASDAATVRFYATTPAIAPATLSDANGKVIWQRPVQIFGGVNEVPLTVRNLPAGRYSFQLGDRSVRLAVE